MLKKIIVLIRLIRVKQWTKNLFIFAPIIFAFDFLNSSSVLLTVKTFIAFCLASSFVYIVNDIFDKEKDRLHEIKKNRPIASGKINTAEALIAAFISLSISLVLSFYINSWVFIVILLYIIMNFAYSLKLKNIVILDAFVISFGFILRILAGAYSINVPLSQWMILTTFFLTLFLAFSKRRSEMEFSNKGHRSVLACYSKKILDVFLTVSLALTVIAYSQYTMNEDTIKRFGTDKLIYTNIFVVFGLFRYLLLVKSRRSSGDPADIILGDVALIFNILLWVLCVFLFITKVI